METKLEAILKIFKNGSLYAVVDREEKSGHQVFYKVEEMNTSDIEELFS